MLPMHACCLPEYLQTAMGLIAVQLVAIVIHSLWQEGMTAQQDGVLVHLRYHTMCILIIYLGEWGHASLRRGRVESSAKVTARPLLPARAVRPMRCR